MTEVLAPAPEVPPVGEVLTAETARLLRRGDVISYGPYEPMIVGKHGTTADSISVAVENGECFTFLSRQSDPAGDDGSSPKTAIPAAAEGEVAGHVDSSSGSVYDRLLTLIHDRDCALRGDDRTDPDEIDEAVLEIMKIAAVPTHEEGAVSFTLAEWTEAGEIGERDGYEKAIQDLDLATGGDGEFKATTNDGVVDVQAMRLRIIDRIAHPAQQSSVSSLVEALEPFAAAAALYREDARSDLVLSAPVLRLQTMLTVANLRAARAAIAKATGAA